MLELLPKAPLCQDSNINVWKPSLDFFTERIKKQQPFSFTRQLHGLWDAIIGAWIMEPSLRKIQLDNPDYIQRLSIAMSVGKQAVEGLYYPPSLYVDLLHILRNLEAMPEDFFFGIGDTYFYPEETAPYTTKDYTLPHKCPFKYLPIQNKLRFYKLRFGDRQEVMQYFLPKNQIFFDGLLWKKYVYHRQISTFFDVIKDFQVTCIAPQHYQNFDRMVGLPHYKHIKIHHSKASEYKEVLLNQILEVHQHNQHGFPMIYFFVAGSLGVWLIAELRKHISDAFLLDIGQAFNYLYPAKGGLLHREFGLSQINNTTEKYLDTHKWYGKKNLGCKLEILNDEVIFQFQDHFWLNLPERLALFTHERAIRRKWSEIRYQLHFNK